jgi:hypothetical protein
MKRILVSLVAVVAVLGGCKGGNSLDGKWSIATSSSKMPAGSTLNATFSGGDSVAMIMDMPQPLPDGKKINLHADIKGKYKLDGDMMTITVEDVKFTGSGFPNEIKAMMETQMKTMGDQVKDQLNKEGAAKLNWVDNDKFTITGKSGPETFTRVK